ncbi:MAG: cytochrome c oxidase subunit II [Acidobacteriaceae bacterium]|nr:cytochrome c oxidase subunit II [Acidobacteriaceae bacterium]
MRTARVALMLLAGLFVSCGTHQQSAIDPAGPQSENIAGLWWFFFWTLTSIFLAVMVFMLWTLTRRHRGIEQEPLEIRHAPSPETESRINRTVAGCTIATVVILFVLLIASVGTGKSVSELANKNNGLTVDVTGNEWWWHIRYQNSDASMVFDTANEIHIPVGRPVQIRGMSQDVIHSFWVPNLHGKRDLIPSHVTTEWIQADRPGIYRGQCAEFCGLQHAHMSVYVIAEPESKFQDWYNAQLEPAASPSTPVTQHGQQVFLNNACIFCHQIRGTTAGGQNGPDLTHFGSRMGIAANTVPNTKGNLGGWILDPQSMKPGNHMATIALPSTDLQPLIEYLESLK